MLKTQNRTVIMATVMVARRLTVSTLSVRLRWSRRTEMMLEIAAIEMKRDSSTTTEIRVKEK